MQLKRIHSIPFPFYNWNETWKCICKPKALLKLAECPCLWHWYSNLVVSFCSENSLTWIPFSTKDCTHFVPTVVSERPATTKTKHLEYLYHMMAIKSHSILAPFYVMSFCSLFSEIKSQVSFDFSESLHPFHFTIKVIYPMCIVML